MGSELNLENDGWMVKIEPHAAVLGSIISSMDQLSADQPGLIVKLGGTSAGKAVSKIIRKFFR